MLPVLLESILVIESSCFWFCKAVRHTNNIPNLLQRSILLFAEFWISDIVWALSERDGRKKN